MQIQIGSAAEFEITSHIDDCDLDFAVDIFDNGQPSIRFLRNEKRWRIAGGYYCKHHVVASHLFGFNGDFLPDDQADYMLSHIKFMAQLMDDLSSAFYAAWIDQRIRAEAKFREQYICRPRCSSEGSNLSKGKSVVLDGFNGHLYLMRHANGLTKIGKSNNPSVREKTLQAEDPRLAIEYVAKNMGGYERALHGIFKDFRKRGEWFDLNDHHIQWIKFFFDGLPSQ